MSPGIGIGVGLPFGGFSGAAGFDVYLDTVNGNDANSGTSEAQALASVSALPTITEGMRIGIARGSSFTEQLSLGSAANVYVAEYGDTADPLPLFDCTDAASNAGWSATGGRTNVYERSWAHSLTSAQTRHFAYEEGDRLTYVADVATCDSTPGSYTYSGNANVSPITIYIHPKSSTNPTSDGKAYRLTARQYGITATGSGVTVKGCHATKNAHNDGAIALYGANSLIENCLVTWGQKHHFFVNAIGGVCRGCVGYLGQSPFENSTTFVAYHDNASVSDAECSFIDCYVRVNEADNVTIPALAVEGFYCHVNSAPAAIAKVTYSGCYVENILRAYSSTAAVTDITDCYANQCRHTAQGGGTINLDNVVSRATSAVVGANQARMINLGGGTAINCTDVRWVSDGIVTPFAGMSSGGALTLQSSSIIAINEVVPNQAGDVTIYDSVLNSRKFYNRSGSGKLITAADRNAFDEEQNPDDYIVNATTYNTLATLQAAYPAIDPNSAEGSGILTYANAAANNWTPGGAADTGGRTAGSRKHIAAPDWTTLKTAWAAGYLGIDGTGP